MAVTFREQHIEDLRKELAELDERASLIRRVIDGHEAAQALRLKTSQGAAEPEAEDEVSEEEPLTAAVEKVVRNAGGALAPSAIRAVLMQNESYAPRLEKTPTYLYSVLFRLVKQGRLRKVGDRYAAPTKSAEMQP